MFGENKSRVVKNKKMVATKALFGRSLVADDLSD